jgi:hypothetical protein
VLSGVPGVGAVPAIGAAAVLAVSSSAAVVMVRGLSFFSVRVRAADTQRTRLWSLMG